MGKCKDCVCERVYNGKIIRCTEMHKLNMLKHSLESFANDLKEANSVLKNCHKKLKMNH